MWIRSVICEIDSVRIVKQKSWNVKIKILKPTFIKIL